MKLLRDDRGRYFVPTEDLMALAEYAQDRPQPESHIYYLNIYFQRDLRNIPIISIAFLTTAQLLQILDLLFIDVPRPEYGHDSIIRLDPNIFPKRTSHDRKDNVVDIFNDSAFMTIEPTPAQKSPS